MTGSRGFLAVHRLGGRLDHAGARPDAGAGEAASAAALPLCSLVEGPPLKAQPLRRTLRASVTFPPALAPRLAVLVSLPRPSVLKG